MKKGREATEMGLNKRILNGVVLRKMRSKRTVIHNVRKKRVRNSGIPKEERWFGEFDTHKTC